MNTHPFNGSDDPVYQETMQSAQGQITGTLTALRQTLDMLDGHEETAPEFEALLSAVSRLEDTAADKFEI